MQLLQMRSIEKTGERSMVKFNPMRRREFIEVLVGKLEEILVPQLEGKTHVYGKTVKEFQAYKDLVRHYIQDFIIELLQHEEAKHMRLKGFHLCA